MSFPTVEELKDGIKFKMSEIKCLIEDTVLNAEDVEGYLDDEKDFDGKLIWGSCDELVRDLEKMRRLASEAKENSLLIGMIEKEKEKDA